MKIFLVVYLIGLVFIQAEAKRQRDPFAELKEQIQNLPPLILTDKGSGAGEYLGKMKLIRKRKILLKKLIREKFHKLVKDLGKEIKAVKSSINALEIIHEKEEIEKEKKYYEKRQVASENKYRVLVEEFDWLMECYDQDTVYSSPDDAARENPFGELLSKLIKIPKTPSKVKKLSRQQVKNYQSKAKMLKVIYYKNKKLNNDLLDDIERLESSMESLQEILDSKQGQKKKDYYTNRLEKTEEEIANKESELEWLEQCFDFAYDKEK